jgi:hypothetical protein
MTVHGLMPGGETWSCGLRTYRRPTFLSTASGQALANAVANRWRTFQNDMPNMFGVYSGGSVVTVAGVTVREINDDGVGETQYEGLPSIAVAGAGSAPASCLPNQITLCVSLLTARAGRTGKGRIFLPYAVGGVQPATGQTAVQTGAAGFVKTLLDGINTDLTTHFGSTLKLAVQSPTSAQKWFDDNSLADYNGAVITGFKIGNVLDTQRRRRSSLIEVYAPGVVA